MRFLLTLFLATLPALAEADLRVIDGDTLVIDDQVYRINGIDAPEVGQRCSDGTKRWQCGKDAANALLQLVAGQVVQCVEHSRDQYGRAIATCTVARIDIGQHLVATGYAWAFRRYSQAYIADEDAARLAGVGIWQAENEPPWEFRAKAWQARVNTSPRPGCPIKGNISQNGRIYHTPWSPWYDRTVISEAKGERWFCDELEAVQAGWRAPYWP